MEEKETQKLSYEQLEKLAAQYKEALVEVSNKLRTIEFAALRLNWLFKVLENGDRFSVDFINKCSKEVENMLTIDNSNNKES